MFSINITLKSSLNTYINCYTMNSYNLLNKLKFFKSFSTNAIKNLEILKICTEETKCALGCSQHILQKLLENKKIENIEFHIEKLSASNHPIFAVAEKIFKNEIPAWGSIVLLLSKAGGVCRNVKKTEQDTNILHKQKMLAEVTDMIHTAVLIHNTIKNNSDDISNNQNKITLLIGDYIASKAITELSYIRNNDVCYIISSAVRNVSEGYFINPINYKNCLLPKMIPNTSLNDENNLDQGPFNIDEIMGNYKDEWILRNILKSANLLGKSCQAVTILGGHQQHLQEQAYLFGKHLALAWQANIDYNTFQSGKIDLAALPIMLYFQKHLSLHKEIEYDLENIDKTNLDKIRLEVIESSVLKETKNLQKVYVDRALNNLSHFNKNSAQTSLIKILLSFK